MHRTVKSFSLKFRHVTARVTVVQNSEQHNFSAFIVFPKAYIIKEYNNFTLPDITAKNIDNASEIAYLQFKDFYKFLDKRMREIGTHNFYVHRIRFRTAVERKVDDFTASFVITRQFYAISENVDGAKYNKCKFWNKEYLSTFNVLFLINFQEIIEHMNRWGFNHKFVSRVIRKSDNTPISKLRMYDAGETIDDLERHPHRLSKHVVDNRDAFYNAIIIHKVRQK